MIREEVKQLLDDYFAWLKQRISLSEIAGRVEITTPFLDRHNDRIQIYVSRENGSIVVSDEGYTIADLELSGLDIKKSERRQQMLQTILNGFGILRDGDRIYTIATKESFAQKKHNLVQSLLAVNDLFALSQPHVLNLFLEDVAAWLTQNDVRYSPNIRLPGKSGFDHNFDFVIPRSRKKSERLVKAINLPNKERIGSLLWALEDVRALRQDECVGVAILNDREMEIRPELQDALRQYGILNIPWSRRADFIGELAA